MITTLAPDIVSLLPLECEDLIERAGQLFKAADRVPKELADDEQSGKTGDFVKQINAFLSEAEASRKRIKQPYLDCGKAIDGFFSGLTEPVEKVKGEMGARVARYLNAKRLEERKNTPEPIRVRGNFGSTASLKMKWRGVIVDRAKLDIAALTPYLTDEALLDALQEFVKAGGRTLAGADIKEVATARIR
ncbi:hypothetical protein KGP36_07460 [Patescibacteria group bacterium]|nr:hypothetical protein [Patescibacteria group bacterium]